MIGSQVYITMLEILRKNSHAGALNPKPDSSSGGNYSGSGRDWLDWAIDAKSHISKLSWQARESITVVFDKNSDKYIERPAPEIVRLVQDGAYRWFESLPADLQHQGIFITENV